MAAKAWTDPHPIATIPVDVTGKQITPIINKQLIFLIWTYFPPIFHRHHRDFDGYEDFDAVFGFPSFVFRDPEEVFREFFGGADPFEDLLDRKLILNNHPGFLMSKRSMNARFLLFQLLDSWVVDTVLPDLLGIIIIPHITIPPINTTTLPPTP